MMNNNIGIPTIGARGLQFRSRLEAQWSYVFTELNWNWEYEPYDLNGYIPDFIVVFANGNELLIEVKSIMNVWDKEKECKAYIDKIFNSGWQKMFMIVGANVGLGKYSANGGDGVSLGIVGGSHDDVDDDGRIWTLPYPVIELNNSDNSWSIISDDSDRDGYDLGLNNGEQIYSNRHDDTPAIFQQIWTKSKNMTQWKKKSK